MATKASIDVEIAQTQLAGSGWLTHTSPQFTTALLDLAHWRRYGPGETIMHAGDSNGDLFGLALGTAGITSSLGPADSPVSHIISATSWLGYGPLITNQTRVLSCTARSPVLAAQIGHSALRQHLAAHPEHWRFVAVLALENANVAFNIATDLMIRSSHRRCAATLLRIAGCRFADTPPPAIAWTNQEELGGIANLARSTLNLILGDLEGEGLISRGYNQIIIHNPEALRAIADG